MAAEMVVVNGVRYRVEDAERLGLKPDADDDQKAERDEKAAERPANKARKPQSNK